MYLYVLIGLISIWAAIGAKINTLPPYLKKCKFQVPEIEVGNCIGEAMEDALRKMKNGEPSLGIQPLDPLLVSSLDILQGIGPVSLNIHHKNLKITGISQCKVVKNRFRKSDGTLSGKMFCPKITLDGDYELSGRILLLPVRGKGKSIIEMDKNDCEFLAIGQHDLRNGTLYEKYSKITFNIQPKKFRMNFANLFGDERLSKNMNQFINDNWREILNEVKPSYEQVMAQVFKDTVDKVFNHIPVVNILTDYASLNATKTPQ